MRLERNPLEESARFKTHWDITVFRLREKRAQRRVLFSIAGNVNRAQPLIRAESLFYRMDSIDDVVEVDTAIQDALFGSGAGVARTTLQLVPSFVSCSSTPHCASASRSRSEAAQSFARRASARNAMMRSIASGGASPARSGNTVCRRSMRSEGNSATGSSSHDAFGSMPRTSANSAGPPTLALRRRDPSWDRADYRQSRRAPQVPPRCSCRRRAPTPSACVEPGGRAGAALQLICKER